MAILSSKALIAVRTEASEGSGDVPSNTTHALLASNVAITFNPTLVNRNENLPHLSPTGSVLAQRYAVLSFTSPIKGNNSPGVLPREDALWRAAGCSPAVAAGSSCVYTPNSAFAVGANTASIYAYLGADSTATGARHAFKACRANVEVVFDTTDYGRLNWQIWGIYAPQNATPGVSDGIYDSNTGSVAFEAYNIVPPACINGTVAMYGVAQGAGKIAQRIVMNLNNDVQIRPDLGGGSTTDNGIFGFLIRGRRPGGTFNPEYVARSTFDFFYNWESQVKGQLAYTVGSAAGNKFQMNAPAISMDNVAWGDRNGNRIIDCTYVANTVGGGGDDEVSFVYS